MQTNEIKIYPDQWTKILITLSVMLVTIIEILDMTIVNVALPPMMGQLGANSDQITWILTSYIVASAVMMPLTGFLVARVGRKKLLLIAITGFLLASMMCGISTSLAEMVVFRTFQGLFGASLVPMSQYILRDTYPPAEQGKAMAIWGFGIMVAPVMGPTLGGYITEWLNWRWVFFINIPVCIIAILLTIRSIQETPIEHSKIDIVGLLLMISGVSCLQIFLDRGNSSDWFGSNVIVLLALSAIILLSTFIIRGLYISDNIINLRLFKDRNFALSTLMLTLFSMGIISIISVQPLLYEHLMNYTAETAGLVMAPRGIAAAISMVLAGILLPKVDIRYLLLAGLLLCDIGTYMMSKVNLQTSFSVFAWQGFLQGIGMGLFFVPISTLALSNLPENALAEASGLFSFGRSLGCSIGISVLSTIISQQSEVNWNQLGGHLTATSYNLQHWLQVQHTTLDNPQTLQQLAAELFSQSTMIAFTDTFWIVSVTFLFMIPMVCFLKKAKASASGGAIH